MKKRRLLSSGLALCLTAGLLAGCSGGNGSSTSSPSPTASATASNAGGKQEPAAEAKSYTIKLFTTRIQPDPGAPILKAINENLGHTVEVTAIPDANYTEKLNLYYASNDMPDIFQAATEEIRKNGTAKFTEEELKTHMPLSYAAGLEQFEEYGVTKEAAMKRFSVDGQLASFTMGSKELIYPYGLVIRQDMLDDFGLEMPKTLEDWEVFLKAFKAKYPDKYPLTSRGKDSIIQSFYPFLSAFGTTYSNWQLKDGKLVYGPFMPEMRDALALLADWYKAGYINPEWITMDNAAVNNDWINGNSALMQWVNLGNAISAPFSPGSIFESLSLGNPNAKMAWAPFPVWKPEVLPAVPTYEGITNYGVSFGKHLEQDREKLYAAMKVADQLASDKDTWMMLTYGIDGQTYDMVDGLPVIRKEVNSNEGRVKEGFGWYFLAIPGRNWAVNETTKTQVYKEQFGKYAQNDDGIYSRKNTDWAFNHVNGVLTSPSGENLDVKGKAKSEEWGTVFASVIIGNKSLEDFDNFIAAWKKEVGDEMTEAANRLYLEQWQ